MKVVLTSDQLGPNPNFDHKQPVGPNNLVNRVVPKGTQIEHPEALIFVINKQAEPVDQEAKDAWDRHLLRRLEAFKRKNGESRPAILTPPETAETAKVGGVKTGAGKGGAGKK